MRFSTLLSLSSAIGFATADALERRQGPPPSGEFPNKLIYYPPNGTTVMYPRAAELSDGTILATIGWRGAPTTNNSTKPYFPVFESKNGGWTWKQVSNLTDQVNGLGMSAQPAIMELPYDIGDFPKGTVLGSGNSWNNFSTIIDVYASFDKGHNWEFVSNVARGGRPNTTNGADPIWEPFMLPYEGTLGMFYSDQRDPLHGQKLAHQESDDLKNWGPVINDVAYLNYTVRPGMTVIDYIPPIDKWVFVYEYPPGAGGINYFTNQYPVYYKIVSNPFDFRYADGFPLVTENAVPNGSPYVVWSPVGGENGTLIVSDADTQEVFTNQYLGRVDKWVKREQPGRPAYSRAMLVQKDNPDHLMIFSGATFDGDPEGKVEPFAVTVLSITKLLEGGYTNHS